MSLRTRILLAIVCTVLVGDLVGTWAVHERLSAGSQREAADQAEARAQQVRALIDERTATLEKEGEAISLYPAVIQALVDSNPTPLRRWSAQVASLQGTSVTVTDASGLVVARGHAPDQTGDNLSGDLAGLRQALAGKHASGAEAGDELGLALRGYVPVLHDGLSGPIVGAVMIAQPFDTAFINQLTGGQSSTTNARIDGTPLSATTTSGMQCADPPDVAASCTVALIGPTGDPVDSLQFEVPLVEIQQAQQEAELRLWLISAAVLVLGTAAAWLLARSLSGPLSALLAAVERITAGNLHQPLEDTRQGDEIGALSRAFERMRQHVAESTAQLRDERDVLDAVLESAGDGILMVDHAGNTVVVNQAWTDLVGSARLNSLSGFKACENPGESMAETTARWMADVTRIAGADFDRPEPYMRLRGYTAPVRHHDRTIIGRIFVLRDVTRETEAERMRSALVATVSHELRAPLTAITGYTDTLLHEGPWDNATQHEFLEVVALSATRLSALVDNLLDAATLEAGVLQLQLEPVRVERIAESVLAHRRLLAGGCTLHIETRPGLPLVDADPLRIEQVLTNLVDNAIKYSPDGGAIEVRLTKAPDDALVVSVSDHGLGIAPNHLPHLFERFYRAESRSRTIKGVGLGLYICRSLVEAHGGAMWVESQPGTGSTFSFRLPASQVGAQADRQLASARI